MNKTTTASGRHLKARGLPGAAPELQDEHPVVVCTSNYDGSDGGYEHPDRQPDFDPYNRPNSLEHDKPPQVSDSTVAALLEMIEDIKDIAARTRVSTENLVQEITTREITTVRSTLELAARQQVNEQKKAMINVFNTLKEELHRDMQETSLRVGRDIAAQAAASMQTLDTRVDEAIASRLTQKTNETAFRLFKGLSVFLLLIAALAVGAFFSGLSLNMIYIGTVVPVLIAYIIWCKSV